MKRILGPSGSKAAGEWSWPPTSSSAKVKESVLRLWTFVACSRVNFTFPFT